MQARTGLRRPQARQRPGKPPPMTATSGRVTGRPHHRAPGIRGLYRRRLGAPAIAGSGPDAQFHELMTIRSIRPQKCKKLTGTLTCASTLTPSSDIGCRPRARAQKTSSRIGLRTARKTRSPGDRRLGWSARSFGDAGVHSGHIDFCCSWIKEQMRRRGSAK